MKFELLEQKGEYLSKNVPSESNLTPDQLDSFGLYLAGMVVNAKQQKSIDKLKNVPLTIFLEAFLGLPTERERISFVEKLLGGASNLDQNFLDDMKNRTSEQIKQFIYHTAMNNAGVFAKKGFDKFTLYKPQATPEKYIASGEIIDYVKNQNTTKELMIETLIEMIIKKL